MPQVMVAPNREPGSIAPPSDRERDYRFAGRWLRVDFALKAVASAGHAAAIRPSLRIQAPSPPAAPAPVSHWLHEWREHDAPPSLQVAHADAARPGWRYRLRFPDQCDFLLEPSTGMVAIEPAPGLDADTLEHLLLDQALPRLLTRQGDLVVHASVVDIDGGVALFLGKSGWGKSTLAGLLHQCGHLPLSDDCALLREQDGAVTAIASYPSLRLYDDSIEGAFSERPDTAPVADYTRKQRVQVAHGDHAGDAQPPRPVTALYLLDDPANDDGHTLAIAPLSAAAACMALVEHTFRLDISAREESTMLLRQAAVVAGRVPAYLLRHPRDFHHSPGLMRLLLQHFATLKRTP